MNIVFIVVDTLRYDAISANGGSIPTPNIDRLATESTAYDRAFCSSFPTIPFRTDVITGRYGAPFHAWLPLPHATHTFVDTLKENGYAAQLIHDTPHLVNGGHNFDYPFHTWTFVRGAEVDRAWLGDGASWLPNWRRDPLFDVCDEDSANFAAYAYTNRNRRTETDWNCARLFDTAARFLQDNRRRDNVFLWVDCFDPHEPWDAPPQFVRRFDPRPEHDGTIDPRQFWGGRNSPSLSDDAKAVMAALYAAKVSWMDHCFGRFLDAFYDTGLSENTALVLVGDHGTNTGHYGRFGKGAPVRDSEAHVPLFIRLPDGEAARSDTIVQPQDLTATLLALGKSTHPDCVGNDLIAGNADREVAIAGPVAGTKDDEAAIMSWDPHFFSVFARDLWLEWQPSVEASILRRYESEGPIAGHDKERGELHRLGISELGARGTHESVVSWLENGAQGGPLPDVPLHARWPGVEGFTQYFKRTYDGD